KIMKNTFKMAFLLLITAFCTLGCTQDTSLLDQAPDNPAIDVKTYGDLEFVYQVTDMEGNPQSTFREGENLMFSFVVKNRSDEDKPVFNRWWFPNAIDDFFALYRTNSKDKILIGKSFKIGGNTYDGFGQGVPAQSEIEYRIPWLTQKDTYYIMPIHRPERDIFNKRGYVAAEPLPEPLLQGEYYSGFTFELQDEEISFSITFLIK